MNNIRTLFLAILVLAAAALWVDFDHHRFPIHEGLDIQGGMRVVLQAETNKLKGKSWTSENLDTVAAIMRNRVDSLGVSEPVIYTKPPDQIVVELPGVKDKQQALDVIKQTARLEFRYVPELENQWHTEPEEVNGKATGFETIRGADGKPVSPDELVARVFSKEPIATGGDLEPRSKADITTGKPLIHFYFQGDARRVFEDFTRSHIGKPLAIFLDNKLISAPRINDVIPGEGIIEGNFTPESAKQLANQLNAGALPVPLDTLQVINVEATLGRQAVHQTMIAGIIGLGLVLLFMLVTYRVPGFLADIALLLYTAFSFAAFKLIPITLTVPGIAGFILSIGMAVDANILIFERMKEERLAGKSIRAAIEAGFKRAFTAIFDSNVCTLITCAILYNFGTGPIRGFALTLAVGVIISLFTAITCSRTFLLLFAQTSAGQNDAVYGLHQGLHPKLGVTRNMWRWFALSGLVIVPGVIFLVMGGLKPSIEFKSGNEITAAFNHPITAAQVTSTVKGAGAKDCRVVLAEGNTAYITTERLDQARDASVRGAIQSQGGSIVSSQSVNPTISRELVWNAIYAVLWASLLIVLYLAIRFSIPSFMEGLKFGISAVVALLHDVLVVLGAFAIFGYFLNWPVDSLFVTAMLTVIGFSVHDTIVIFDRIRENLHHRARGETFADVTDRSIEQTFAHSVNTSFTVILTLLALLFFGGPTIRFFVTALLIGIVSGTYSSIFNASPLLVLWKQLTGDRAIPAPAGGPAPRAAAPRTSVPAAKPRPTPAPKQTPTANGTAEEADASREPVGAASGADRLKPKKRKRRM